MSKEFIELKNKTIFITGVAGFIGSNLAERLLKEIEGIKIVGLDNMNDYYDVRLKEYRLEKLSSSKTFSFVKGNLADKELINSIFEKYTPQVVVNLGAQAGVRYSITNPDAYIEGNLIGFYNILEGCRHYPVEHLVYASSSSVYGSNKKVLPEDYDFEAHKELVPMQPGDVPVTYADTQALERDYGFKPSTTLREGLRKFAEWYKEFYM